MNGRRCDARYHSHNGTWVSWKMLVRFFDGFLFFSARDRRVKRFSSPASPHTPPATTAATSATAAAGNCICLQYLCHWLGLFLHYVRFNSKHFRIFIFQPNLPVAAAAAAAFYWTQSSRIFIDDAMTTPILWARPKINHKSPVLSPK